LEASFLVKFEMQLNKVDTTVETVRCWGLSQSLGFDARQLHLIFVVAEVALEQVSL
jgi:hypothetical protein